MVDISVIIPTIGRKLELLNTLKDLTNQNLPKENWECLIILQSDISVDSLQEIACRHGIRLRVFFLKTPNASLARNIGLCEAKGRIVLFLDDDVRIESDAFLQNHITNYSRSSIPGVSGQVVNPDLRIREERHKWSYKKRVGWLFFPPNYNRRCVVLNGVSANLSVNREYGISVGGMDTNYSKGAHREESDFCLRLTQKYGPMVFDPSASIIHLGTESGGCRQWGMNRGVHPMHHVVGEWYFILKGLKIGTIRWYDLHYHLLVLIWRQIFNDFNRANISLMPKAILNSIIGFKIALRKLKQIPSLTMIGSKVESYRLLFENQ
jgi:glycosyltransferase involved in cell wall biosynthesis